MKTKRLLLLPVLLLLLSVLLSACRAAPTAEFSVLFLDVGQGNAALLRTPQGDVLVDCGPEAEQETLCRKLQANGVKTLKCLILTHADEDHIGGADVILEQFEVANILFNGDEEQTESFVRLHDLALQKGLEMTAVEAGDEGSLGDLQIQFLHPDAKTDSGKGNHSSLVFRAECGGASILFMGDADVSAEESILKRCSAQQLAANILLVGHHGSDTSCGSRFLEAVKPDHAVISCGAGNRYGHPDGRVLARLQDAGAQVYRTDLNGDVTFTWSADSIWINTEKEGN